MQSYNGIKNYDYLWVRHIFSIFLDPIWKGACNYNHVIHIKNKSVAQVHNLVQNDKKMAKEVRILKRLNHAILIQNLYMRSEKGDGSSMPKHMKLETQTWSSTLDETEWPVWRPKHGGDDLYFYVTHIQKKSVVFHGLLHFTNMNNINGMG